MNADKEEDEANFAKPLDLSFSDDEARQFVDNMKDVDLNQLLKVRDVGRHWPGSKQ